MGNIIEIAKERNWIGNVSRKNTGGGAGRDRREIGAGVGIVR